MTAHRIAVIGGGWAGCAAAIALVDAGFDITLYEAAAQVGGRARRVMLDGLALDNGQHLVLGAYRHTRQLLEQLHTRPPVTWRPLKMLPFAEDQQHALSLVAWRLPAPFNLLMAIVCARGLRLRERLATLQWFARLRRAAYRCIPGQTVAQLTATQPSTVSASLWHPLCIAALNTPPATASAQAFANILRAAFDGTAEDAYLMHAESDTGTLFADSAMRWLAAREQQVALRSVATITEAQRSRVAISLRNATHWHRAALVAVAPNQLAHAFAPSLVTREQAVRNALAMIDQLSFEPITTVYLGYAQHIDLPDALIRLDDSPGQWLFVRPDIVATAGEGAPRLATIVAVVLSARGPHEALDHRALIAAVDKQLRMRRAAWPPLAWSRAITEKRATYACTPAAKRPVAGMLMQDVALAGDYTDDEFPATLEAAVRSGRRAASALIATLR